MERNSNNRPVPLPADDEQEEPSNNNNAATIVGPRIFSLEIGDEEEVESLMRETEESTDMNFNNKSSNLSAALHRNFNFRHRAPHLTVGRGSSNGNHNHATTTTATVLGLLRARIGNASSLRSVGLLCVLAAASWLLLYVLDVDFLHNATAPTQLKPKTQPHGPSLGGHLNTGHYNAPNNYGDDDLWNLLDDAAAYGSDDLYYYYGNGDDDLFAAAADDDDSTTKTTISDRLPKSNVGAAVASLSRANRQNKAGHYLHDWHKSPYASPYYKYNNSNTASVTQQAAIQAQFEAQRAAYEIKYGLYQVPEWPGDDGFTVPRVADHKYKDVPELDATDWPVDGAYVRDFLEQAKLLVERVKEGIYEEYGYGVVGVASTVEKSAIISKRLPAFQVVIDDNAYNKTKTKVPGIAHLNTAAWEGLIRKLLHAMITGDEFYVVAAGSAALYRGNNFAQSAVMQFDYLLQPVLDKLGVRLISRNMGTAAPTTLHALAGADVYGEADIFWHIVEDATTDDGTQHETMGQVDLLHRQAILSGERVPVILTPNPANLVVDTENAVWMGNLLPGADFCERTVYKDGETVVPSVPACRYVHCDADADCDVHNSVCWVERSDQTPQTEQRKDVGHQDEGYPNSQVQRLESRKLAMLVLHALDEALDRWVEQSEMGILPLPNDAWHVGPAYERLRKQVRTLPGGGYCDRLLQHLDPQICHMEMHSYTEWTPRVRPSSSRLKKLVQGDIADNHASLFEVYTGVDLLPPQWRLSDDEVDVHMIAIATESDMLPHGNDENAIVVGDDDAYGFPWPNDDDGWMYAEDDDLDYGFGDDDYRRRELNPSSGQSRKLLTHDVSNTAWTVFNAPLGFCDGSAQSTCNRIISNPWYVRELPSGSRNMALSCSLNGQLCDACYPSSLNLFFLAFPHC